MVTALRIALQDNTMILLIAIAPIVHLDVLPVNIILAHMLLVVLAATLVSSIVVPI
jgi:hypothetical protein